MPTIIRSFCLLLTLVMSTIATGQTAQEILEEVIERDQQRKSSVQNYVVNQCTMGFPVMLYYERVERDLNGENYSTFRLVPPNEIAQRENAGPGLTPEQMDQYASALETAGDTLSREMSQAGVPLDTLALPGSSDEPWASPDPRVMMGSMAMFMRAAASAERDQASNAQNTELLSSADQFEQLVDNAELVGRESIEGRPAFHIRVEGVEYTQDTNGGQQFDVDEVSIWIDQDNYVPLQMQMNGIAEVNGESVEMTMEMRSLDFQQIGPLLEPTRQVISMGGILTAEQEAELAEARVQLAEAREQLNELSGSQRQMMENMMGPQLAMLEDLVNNGRVEVETLTPRIQVNVGLPDEVELNSAASDTDLCGSGGGLFGVPTSTSATASGSGLSGIFGGADPDSPVSDGAGSGDADSVPLAEVQRCLEQKIEEARADQPRRRGLGGFLGGIGQAVSQLGDFDIGGLASSLFDPDASEDDIAERAREMGLTEEDIMECR